MLGRLVPLFELVGLKKTYELFFFYGPLMRCTSMQRLFKVIHEGVAILQRFWFYATEALTLHTLAKHI